MTIRKKIYCYVRGMEHAEFTKLDNTDRKILFWLMDNRPRQLKSWIEYTTALYKRKGIIIDAGKLYAEVILELPEATRASLPEDGMSARTHATLPESISVQNV